MKIRVLKDFSFWSFFWVYSYSIRKYLEGQNGLVVYKKTNKVQRAGASVFFGHFGRQETKSFLKMRSCPSWNWRVPLCNSIGWRTKLCIKDGPLTLVGFSHLLTSRWNSLAVQFLWQFGGLVVWRGVWGWTALWQAVSCV